MRSSRGGGLRGHANSSPPWKCQFPLPRSLAGHVPGAAGCHLGAASQGRRRGPRGRRRRGVVGLQGVLESQGSPRGCHRSGPQSAGLWGAPAAHTDQGDLARTSRGYRRSGFYRAGRGVPAPQTWALMGGMGLPVFPSDAWGSGCRSTPGGLFIYTKNIGSIFR